MRICCRHFSMSHSETRTFASAASSAVSILPNVYSGTTPLIENPKNGCRLPSVVTLREKRVLCGYNTVPSSGGRTPKVDWADHPWNHGVHLASSSCAWVNASRARAAHRLGKFRSASARHSASVLWCARIVAVATDGSSKESVPLSTGAVGEGSVGGGSSAARAADASDADTATTKSRKRH